jgi:hypothetical protein
LMTWLSPLGQVLLLLQLLLLLPLLAVVAT